MIARFSLILFAIFIAVTPAAVRAADVAILNVSVDHGVPLVLSAPATSVFIANPEVADVQVMSPTSIMVFGKRTGETTLMATDRSGHALLHRTVVVSQDLSDLRRELKLAIPDNKIRAEAVPGAIVLTGETRDPSSVEDARKIAARYTKDGTVINRIHVVGSNQIMLRVRFAEVSRSIDNSFGINWESLTSLGGFAFGIASGSAVLPVGNLASGSSVLGVVRPNNATLNTPNDVISLGHQGSHFNVNGLIDALAQDGLVTILAEPNLTAMSGETAHFLAGGEFPIPIPQANGTLSIEYKDYGVSLEFTPTLVSENRINLHVKPRVSKLTDIGTVIINNNTVPSLTVREAETTVELASGQSFAVAGLLDNDQSQTVNKYPFLGDLPILGALFRSTEFQNGQSELVIIITPYIVKPGATAEAMALPTDGFSPPSEAERLLGLRNSSGDPNARPMSGAPMAIPAPAPVPGPGASLPGPVTPNNLVADQPPQDGAPIPAAAPVTPVSTNAPLPMPAQSTSSSGPDGFLLE